MTELWRAPRENKEPREEHKHPPQHPPSIGHASLNEAVTKSSYSAQRAHSDGMDSEASPGYKHANFKYVFLNNTHAFLLLVQRHAAQQQQQRQQ